MVTPETERPRTIAQRFFAVLDGGCLDELEALLAPGFRSGVPGLAPGPAMYRRMLVQYRAAFSDLRTRVDTMIAEDDRVAVLATTSGRQTGDFLGHPPNGASFEAEGVDVLWIADGLIVRRAGVFDALTMLHQLGLYVPVPGNGAPA